MPLVPVEVEETSGKTSSVLADVRCREARITYL